MAVLSIIVGLLLLLENFGYIKNVNLLWPVFPLVIGIGLIMLFFQSGRRDLKILGIGLFLAQSSVIFFFYNFSSWSIISKTWPLFLLCLGISSFSAAFFRRDAKILKNSGLFLMFLALAFILIFSLDARFWPVSLVLFGIWLLTIKGAMNEKKSINR